MPYPVEKVVEKIVHVPKPFVTFFKLSVKLVLMQVNKLMDLLSLFSYPYPVIKHIEVPIKVPIPYEVEKKVPYPGM